MCENVDWTEFEESIREVRHAIAEIQVLQDNKQNFMIYGNHLQTIYVYPMDQEWPLATLIFLGNPRWWLQAHQWRKWPQKIEYHASSNVDSKTHKCQKKWTVDEFAKQGADMHFIGLFGLSKCEVKKELQDWKDD